MNIQSLITVFCVVGAIQFSYAQNSTYMVDGVDTTPLVEALNAQVTTLEKPIKVYHWFNADPNSKWAEQYSANDPRGFEFVKFASQKYWNEYLNPSVDLYGTGLYTALDPVASQSYGGSNWVLVQIELPAGFRFIDIEKHLDSPIEPPVLKTLNAIDCKSFTSELSSLFTSKSFASDQCLKNVRRTLKSFLRIDALMYEFNSTKFAVCGHSDRSKALIIIDSSRFTPQNIQIFNTKTRDALVERTTLQSLFYKSAYESSRSDEIFVHSDFAFLHISREVKKHYQNFEIQKNNYSDRTVRICPNGVKGEALECKSVPMPIPLAVEYKMISSNDIPFTTMDDFEGLLWKDLDGKPTDPKIDEWIANNLYKCGK